ncbi:acyltransferase [Salmonella enterica subsp. enterica serovar Hull]|uniref:Acyltransferase n=3 Tax=Salmonella enterica TaxID=28901 RepID=A0A5I6HKS4_SALET|nr:acyltransferase [Salmonella enterica]EBR8488326.1 acyltransferase [Salmonella enterica subsp. enterica serovar Hull]ECJ4974212.1 acyltransferase [Salmonella enterica subsp. enterica]EAY5229027.1 acyltransferase [Salmonella enterica]EBS2740744.1 acyltransferase [Salmonella enterica subsp. enterica serovar Hull]EBW5988644.1 acyltransferase [Salmonella enterica subsp. enterica serovar Hull]
MLTLQKTKELKGISIVLVMLFHLVTIHKTTLPYELRWVASFGVSVFLLMSGYGLFLSEKRNGLKDFLKKRFSSVYIPFVVATFLIGVLNEVSYKSFIDVLKTVLFINPTLPVDGTMWFIYFICFWYLAFYIIFKALKNDALRISILFFISVFISKIGTVEGVENLTYQSSLHAFSFPAGVLLGYVKPNRLFSLILGVIFLVIFSYFFYHLLIAPETYMFVISCFSFGLCIILLHSIHNINFYVISLIGMYSYEIYLLEGAFLRFNYSENLISNAIAFILITTSCAIAMQSLNKKIVNKVMP